MAQNRKPVPIPTVVTKIEFIHLVLRFSTEFIACQLWCTMADLGKMLEQLKTTVLVIYDAKR